MILNNRSREGDSNYIYIREDLKNSEIAYNLSLLNSNSSSSLKDLRSLSRL